MALNSSEDDESPTRKPKRKKRDELVHQVREKHEDHYNGVQYRLWAEMLDVNTYK